MNDNPLDNPGTKFRLDAWNPNAASRSTKAGPLYRISFEVDKDTYDMFITAQNPSGMILTMMGTVVGEKKGEIGKGVGLPQNAAFACKDPEFQRYCAETMGVEDTEAGAREAILDVCGITSRSELAYNEKAASLYKRMRLDFTRWRG